MSIRTKRLWAAGATLILLLSAGGCVVEIEGKNEPPTSPKKERVLEAGEETWDLRIPPGREEAGMPRGEPYVIYEPHGWWRDPPLRAHILLPEGKRIDAQVGLVAFDSYLPPCGKRAETSGPTTMDISIDSVPLDEAHRRLLKEAELFGFARRYVEEWYSEAKRVDAREGAWHTVRSSIPTSKVGYVRFFV